MDGFILNEVVHVQLFFVEKHVVSRRKGSKKNRNGAIPTTLNGDAACNPVFQSILGHRIWSKESLLIELSMCVLVFSLSLQPTTINQGFPHLSGFQRAGDTDPKNCGR